MEIDKQLLVQSLENIGKVPAFQNIKEACLEGHFNIEATRLNNMGEILRCIKLYVILKDIKKLTGRKLEVLSYYLMYGYSKKTKQEIIKEIKITDSNLNNINHELRKMGVINSVGYNQSANKVNEELLKFKDFIVDQKGKYVLMKVS